MADDPTLTDEELANLEGSLRQDPDRATITLFKTDARLLIAALRANRDIANKALERPHGRINTDWLKDVEDFNKIAGN